MMSRSSQDTDRSDPVFRHKCALNYDNMKYIQLSSNPPVNIVTPSSLGILNAHSVRKAERIQDITDHVVEFDLDIIGFTETWLSDGDKDRSIVKSLTLPGYSFVHLPRAQEEEEAVLVSCIRPP